MTEKFAIVVITEYLSSGGLKHEHVDFNIYEVDQETIEDVYQQELEHLKKYQFYKATYLVQIMKEEVRAP